MTKAIADIRKRRGRPATGSTGIMVKMPPDQLAVLDAWIDARPEKVSRPEAVRRILGTALEADESSR